MASKTPQRKIELVLRKGRLNDDQDREFLEYWLSRPMEERIAHVEELRRWYHGEDYETTQGLSRADLRIERRPR